MPKHLQKSLQDYLSKIKRFTPDNQHSSNSFSTSRNWNILSGCKHPKTLSFAVDRNPNDGRNNNNNDNDNNNNNDVAATLSDIDRFLQENFKSLYVKDDEDNKKKGEESDRDHKSASFGSPRFVEPPPDLCGSHRFFVAPGLSSSLIEEARISLTASVTEDMASNSTSSSTSTTITNNTLNDQSSTVPCKGARRLPDDCIAVITYSPSPYDAFRRSMQEMVEARLQHHAKVDWEFLEELLFSYLNLNEKSSYKFILSAFADLITLLRQNNYTDKNPGRSRTDFRVARQRRRKMRYVT